jgi:hypothetical protein
MELTPPTFNHTQKAYMPEFFEPSLRLASFEMPPPGPGRFLSGAYKAVAKKRRSIGDGPTSGDFREERGSGGGTEISHDQG